MIKLLTVEEHKRSMRKIYYKHKKKLAEEVKKSEVQTERKLTPHNSLFRSLFEAWLAIEKWLRNHGKSK